MNLRPAISVPLPWLIILFGKLSGRKRGQAKDFRRRPLFRLPRSLTITREGKWFIAVLFFIGIAAINTGNNLLYLVVATLLALIIISGIMSESTLRGVRVARTLPRYVYKGAPVIVRLCVKNHKKFFPSFSFTVREIAGGGVSAGAAYTLKLGPLEETVRTSRYTFTKRGVNEFHGLKVSTRFPFGLFIKGKEELIKDEVVVYPAVRPVKHSIAGGGHPSSGLMVHSGKGGGTELYALRDYTLQDDSRYIHWRSSARNLKLLYKEFEKESERKAYVVFDNFGTDDENAFEDAVDEAASLANYYIEAGFAVGLKTLDLEIYPKPGPGHLMRILHTLALINQADVRGRPSAKVISQS